MQTRESLGIRKIESIHYYVRDLERSRKFYCGMMDFAETGEHSRSADGHEAKERNGEPARKQCGVFHRKSPGRSMGTILPRLVAAQSAGTSTSHRLPRFTRPNGRADVAV